MAVLDDVQPDWEAAERYWNRRPAWADRDQIKADLAFTMGVVGAVRPQRMLEIGVSAGVTSGAMLTAAPDAVLDAVDISETVYYNPEKPVGAVVAEAFPECASRYNVVTKATSVDVAGLDARYDVAFIDGEHAHPWASFDLLCVLPFLRQEAVVILHDIHYFCTHSQGGFCLYESLDLPKHKLDNIGCVVIDQRIPGVLDRLLDSLYRAFRINWQDMLPLESIETARLVLDRTLGRDVAGRFCAMLAEKSKEYGQAFRIYKYIKQQQWGREQVQRRIAAQYKALTDARQADDASPR